MRLSSTSILSELCVRLCALCDYNHKKRIVQRDPSYSLFNDPINEFQVIQVLQVFYSFCLVYLLQSGRYSPPGSAYANW